MSTIERPRGLPPRRRSRLVSTYAFIGLAVLGGYVWQLFTGWEPARARRDFVPASVRSSPGGYRSFHYWHRGYHGGK